MSTCSYLKPAASETFMCRSFVVLPVRNTEENEFDSERHSNVNSYENKYLVFHLHPLSIFIQIPTRTRHTRISRLTADMQQLSKMHSRFSRIDNSQLWKTIANDVVRIWQGGSITLKLCAETTEDMTFYRCSIFEIFRSLKTIRLKLVKKP